MITETGLVADVVCAGGLDYYYYHFYYHDWDHHAVDDDEADADFSR